MSALELCLPPGDAARLLRLPSFARRAGRAITVDRVWHDTANGALAADGLSLGEQKGIWRLECAAPEDGTSWPPATPAPLLEEAGDPAALSRAMPGVLMPLAGFRGKQRTALLLDGDNAVQMVLLEGTLRGVTRERAVCRLTLTGPDIPLLALSTEIGTALRVTAPRWSLAAEALALARGTSPAPRRTGAPAIPQGARLEDAVALVLGHLTDVILAGVPYAADAATPDPVHQLRVAVRRLRSALSVFRRAVDAAAFAAVTPGLKQLAAMLGAARDWDVFLGGTGQAVGAALPDDRRIAAMLDAAGRRRTAAYNALGAYFAGPDFHALELALIQLTALRAWEMALTDEQRPALDEPAKLFATHMFERRLDHMLAPGADISDLPVEDLHTIRKAGKRLRYAAEFFAPVYGKRATRRFIARLSVLQEALGHLNDTASAAALMASLGPGADRQFAAGAVQGFVAARQGDTRRDISQAWSKFRRQAPFWAD